MRAFMISVVALLACFSIYGCGSGTVGSLDASKSVMDGPTTTTPPANGGTTTTTPDPNNPNGSETDPDDYIWYDCDGDYFD